MYRARDHWHTNLYQYQRWIGRRKVVERPTLESSNWGAPWAETVERFLGLPNHLILPYQEGPRLPVKNRLLRDG